MRLPAACLAALALGVVAAAAPPKLLVFQRLSPPIDGVDANVACASMLAAELEAEGRVEPVVYSLTDPSLRAMLDERQVSTLKPAPSPEELRAFVKKLGFQYLLVISVQQAGPTVSGMAELYRGGGLKPEWTNAKQTAVQVGSMPSIDSSARSLASSWSALLATGPFKKLPSRPKAHTPDPQPGPIRNLDPPSAPLRPVSDPRPAAEALMREAKPAEAIVMVADAIDASPLDSKLRALMIELLLKAGQPEAAALEARSAAELFPAEVGFQLLAAKSWLRLGRIEEAAADLAGPLSRDAATPEAQLLLGELCLYKGQFDEAINWLTQGLSSQPGARGLLLRAIANAFAGKADACREDLARASQLDSALLANEYENVLALIRQPIDSLRAELFEVLQAGRTTDSSAALTARAEAAKLRATAMAELLDGLRPASLNGPSHQMRKLACKLLVQAAGDVLVFLRTREPNVGDEATLGLSEAAKTFAAADRLYYEELSPTVTVDKRT